MKTFNTLGLILLTTHAISNAKEIETKAQGGTGFAINVLRSFQFDESTVVKEDGITVPQTRAQGGTGFKVRYRLANDANADLTEGTLEEIDLINTHKGPVTSIDPFRIFNIDSLITADTFFDDNLTLEMIQAGDELKVSGFVDSNSSLIVTRIEQDNDPLTEWKLSGYVSQLTASHFHIQEQQIEIGTVIAENCTSGLINGEYVEVKSDPDMTFTAGSTLVNVTSIECVADDIILPPGDIVPVALEGMVDSEDIDLTSSFTISGQTISVDESTLYVNGEIDDILVGTKVEVEGLLNTTSSEIAASKVKFLEVRFKFEESVDPADVIINESIQLFEQTIMVTPQLRDEDNIMASGLGVSTQVEVRGYKDSDGNLFATRVRERGGPDLGDVGVDGPVTAISDPMIEVLGVNIDSSSSAFLDDTGMPISSTDFFSILEVGAEIEVEGSYNEISQVLTAVIIQLDELDTELRNAPIQNKGVTPSGLGIGTITSLDAIFKDSFE